MIEYLLKTSDLLDMSGGEAAILAASAIDYVVKQATESEQFVRGKDVLDQVEAVIDAVEQAEKGQIDAFAGAREGLERIRKSASAGDVETKIIEGLVKAADLLQEGGDVEAAGILDEVIKQAAPVHVPDYPSRSQTREEKYDATDHNKESIRGRLVKEVMENQEHHLEGHQGQAKSLLTRYSPEMPGVQMIRVSDGVYQDPITHKIYDYNSGWSLGDEKNPGGSVKHQTPSFLQYSPPGRLFEGRVKRLRG